MAVEQDDGTTRGEAADKLEEWTAAVTAGMQPGRAPFIASLPRLLVIGGEHWTALSAGRYCWCQPSPVPHNGHIDWKHKRVMD